MPEIIPDHVPSPRTLLAWDGTAYRPVRIHTDGTVQVRGEDQLFSYAESLVSRRAAAISGAGGYIDSATPAAGLIWCITNINSVDLTTATTRHYYSVHRGANDYYFEDDERAIPLGNPGKYHGWVWLHPGDTIRVGMVGSLGGDQCFVDLTGYVMTLEV